MLIASITATFTISVIISLHGGGIRSSNSQLARWMLMLFLPWHHHLIAIPRQRLNHTRRRRKPNERNASVVTCALAIRDATLGKGDISDGTTGLEGGTDIFLSRVEWNVANEDRKLHRFFTRYVTCSHAIVSLRLHLLLGVSVDYENIFPM